LFHDDNPFTINALPKLIEMWTENNFKIHAIGNLIND